MPLMEMTLMDQKKEFILLWKTEQYSLSYLCRGFNISRSTRYRYIEKIKKDGIEGLETRPTIAKIIANKTTQKIEKAIFDIIKF